MEPVAQEELATERRRPGRRAVRLDARFQAGETGPFACVITDYSPEDQMLHLDALQSVSHLAGCDSGELWLEAGAEPETPALKVRVDIRRVDPRGLAVFVGEADAALESRLEAARGSILIAPEDLAQHQRGFAPAFHALLPAASTLVTRGASQLASEFVERAERALLDGLRDARNNREQQLLDSALRRLARFRSAWVRQVGDVMGHAFALLDDPFRHTPTGGERHDAGLSLIELNEFEDYLAVSRVGGALEQTLEEALFDLRRRLELLAGRGFTDESNPLGPRMFCSAFANALRGQIDDVTVSERLFSVMHETLEAGLPALYGALNALLAQHGVLDRVEREKPVIRKQPVREVRPVNDAFGRVEALSPNGAGRGPELGEGPSLRSLAEEQTSLRGGARSLGSLREQMHLARLFTTPDEIEVRPLS